MIDLRLLAHLLTGPMLPTRRGDEKGSGLVEYMLLLAFIALVVMAVVEVFGGKVSTMYSSAESTMP